MTMTRSLLRLGLTAAAMSLVVGCGGEEADLTGPCTSGTKTEAPKAAKTEEGGGGAQGGWSTSLTEADFVAYGKQIFLSKGSNTCNDCHGKDGKKGRLEQAADLTAPSTWRATMALGGDGAKVHTAITYLVSNGGTKFNQNYINDNPGEGWDWSKTGATAYDIQMMGVTQPSTKAEIKNIRKALKKKGVSMEKDEMTAFGTRAVLSYLSSIASDAPVPEARDGKKGKKKKGKKKKGKKK